MRGSGSCRPAKWMITIERKKSVRRRCDAPNGTTPALTCTGTNGRMPAIKYALWDGGARPTAHCVTPTRACRRHRVSAERQSIPSSAISRRNCKVAVSRSQNSNNFGAAGHFGRFLGGRAALNEGASRGPAQSEEHWRAGPGGATIALPSAHVHTDPA